MNAMTEATICTINAMENAAQARDILNWIEALNWATGEALKSDQQSRAKHLAALGQYLASDWANHFDYQADEIARNHGSDT